MPNRTYINAQAVTTSDSTSLVSASHLYIGGAGALSVLTEAGQTVVFAAVTAGTLLPLSVTRVNATGTTATNIVALR